jgi:hypothetical protein
VSFRGPWPISNWHHLFQAKSGQGSWTSGVQSTESASTRNRLTSPPPDEHHPQTKRTVPSILSNRQGSIVTIVSPSVLWCLGFLLDLGLAGFEISVPVASTSPLFAGGGLPDCI